MQACPVCHAAFADMDVLMLHAAECDGTAPYTETHTMDSVRCPLCDGMYPAYQIEAHCGTCFGPQSHIASAPPKHQPQPSSMSTVEQALCPVCNQLFPRDVIVFHASECVGANLDDTQPQAAGQHWDQQQHMTDVSSALSVPPPQKPSGSNEPVIMTDCLLCRARHPTATYTTAASCIVLDGCNHVWAHGCLAHSLNSNIEAARDLARRGRDPSTVLVCPTCRAALSMRDLSLALSVTDYLDLIEKMAHFALETTATSGHDDGSKETKFIKSVAETLKDLIQPTASTCSPTKVNKGEQGTIHARAAPYHKPVTDAATALSPTHMRKSNHAWAKGVGYGGRDRTHATAANRSQESTAFRSKAISKQRQADDDTCMLLNSIRTLLQQIPSTMQIAHHTFDDSNEFEPRSDFTLATTRVIMTTLGLLLSASAALDTILVNLLRNDSLADIVDRAPLYQALMSLLRTFEQHVWLGAILDRNHPLRLEAQRRRSSSRTVQLTDASMTYLSLLNNLRRQAVVYADMIKRDHSAGDDEQTVNATALALEIDDVYRVVSVIAANLQTTAANIVPNPVSVDRSPTRSSTPAATEVSQALVNEYLQKLQPYQFQMEEIDKKHHAFHETISSTANNTPSRERARKLQSDIAALSTSLPLSFNDGIFVRVDPDRNDVIRFMIIGNQNTPYENGCFCFDMFVPLEYPSVPPLVKFRTTDHGRVRFNPNLYNDGKVCLSLLGTWSGPSWDPKQSSLLQVMISIQSFILVEQPYFNEPGFEACADMSAAQHYNENIMFETVNVAIIKELETPVFSEFTEISRTHFRLKAQVIAQQLERWCDSTTRISRADNREYNRRRALKTTFQSTLNKLQNNTFPTPARKPVAVLDLTKADTDYDPYLIDTSLIQEQDEEEEKEDEDMYMY